MTLECRDGTHWVRHHGTPGRRPVYTKRFVDCIASDCALRCVDGHTLTAAVYVCLRA